MLSSVTPEVLYLLSRTDNQSGLFEARLADLREDCQSQYASFTEPNKLTNILTSNGTRAMNYSDVSANVDARNTSSQVPATEDLSPDREVVTSSNSKDVTTIAQDSRDTSSKCVQSIDKEAEHQTESSASSLHLYSMRISQHLRSPSSFSGTSSSQQHESQDHILNHSDFAEIITGVHHRQQRSRSGFQTIELSGALHAGLDQTSSYCSSRINSPAITVPPSHSTPDLPATHGVPTAYNIFADLLPRSTSCVLGRIRAGGLVSPDSTESSVENSVDTKTCGEKHAQSLGEPNAADRSIGNDPAKAAYLTPENPVPNLHGHERSSVSSRSSRFVEDIDTGLSRPTFLKRPTLFNLFSRKSGAIIASDNATATAVYDGASDQAKSAKRKGKQKRKRKPDLLRAAPVENSVSRNRHHGPALPGSPAEKPKGSPCKSITSLSLRGNDEASNLFARALVANQEEKNALLLPEHREQANSIMDMHTPRERSASVNLLCIAGPATPVSQRRASPSTSHASSYDRPVFAAPNFLSPSFGEEDYFGRPSTMRKNSALLDPMDISPGRKLSLESRRAPQERERRVSTDRRPSLHSVPEDTGYAEEDALPNTLFTSSSLGLQATTEQPSSSSCESTGLGAWGLYPSHNREERTGSAGGRDSVLTRDFAYEVGPRLKQDDSSPKIGRASTGLSFGRRSKNNTRFSKSRSMPTGIRRSLNYLRDYSQLFRSQSIEFLQHGHGHRSSISAGGELEHPELEMLPPIFPAFEIDTDRVEGDSVNGVELMEMRRRRMTASSRAHKGDKEAAARDPKTRDIRSAGRLQLDGTPGGDDDDEGDVSFSIYSETSSPSPDHDAGQQSSAELEPLHARTIMQTVGAARCWSQIYASCVRLPPLKSDSPMETDPDLGKGLEARLIPRTNASVIETPLVGADRLHLHGTRSSVSPLLSRVSSPRFSTVPARIRSPSMNDICHRRNESVKSVLSLRASTNDLCRLLVEAEQSDRERCLRAADRLLID